MKSTIEARLHYPAVPTGKGAAVKRFFRAKGKDAARVSADQEEIKTLGEQLDRAIEDFGVRTLITQNLLCVRADDIYQVRSSIRVELVVDDVRALSTRLSKRIQEMNQEIAKQIEEMNREILRTSMNGMLFGVPCHKLTSSYPRNSCYPSPCNWRLLGRGRHRSVHGKHAGAAPG
jgi:hypothetical protein